MKVRGAERLVERGAGSVNDQWGRHASRPHLQFTHYVLRTTHYEPRITNHALGQLYFHTFRCIGGLVTATACA